MKLLPALSVLLTLPTTFSGASSPVAMNPAPVTASPQLIVSEAGHPFRSRPELVSATAATAPDPQALQLDPERTAQLVEGFGGCFNEQGWQVLGLLDPDERERVLRDFFSPDGACRLVFGRMPMGANDYSLDWYSYDETEGDFALEHFSIQRDREHLIPYLKAALRHNPQLRLWASPWCPPSWMKTNRHYAGMPDPANDLRPGQAGREMQTQFRMEPRVLAAYANYFARFLASYREVGIVIEAVHVQNEPNSSQKFPSCVWTPEDLATFVGDYLGPVLRRESPATAIWLGTIERPQLERVDAILGRPAARGFIRGVGFQWAGKDAIPAVHRKYPGLPLMETETECGDGSNDWAAAEHTFGLMQHYFLNGAGTYMYWNLVLDETGNSRWGWRQNAPVTVDRASRRVTYNPEFYLLQHFSHFVRPGAHRLIVEDPAGATVAFRNPDGSLVLVSGNRSDAPVAWRVQLGRIIYGVNLPARAFATLTLPAPQ